MSLFCFLPKTNSQILLSVPPKPLATGDYLEYNKLWLIM